MTLPLPNYTQIPNVILDNTQNLKGSEFKLIIAICRNTFGYHKASQRLSLSFLEKATGLTRSTITNCAKQLIERGWIERHSVETPSGKSWEYSIDLKGVEKLDQSKSLTSLKIEPQGVEKLDCLGVEKLDPINKEFKKRTKKSEALDEGENNLESTPKKTDNELWDEEFEFEFWPIAFKKVSVGKAREAYRAARKKASKESLLAAWRLVNEADFPDLAEEKGSKQFVPMPATWLNQERWDDEDVVARLEEANSPEAKRQELIKAVGAHLRRLNLPGLVPPQLAPDRAKRYTVSELPTENLQKCLDYLAKRPDPSGGPQEVEHAA